MSVQLDLSVPAAPAVAPDGFQPGMSPASGIPFMGRPGDPILTQPPQLEDRGMADLNDDLSDWDGANDPFDHLLLQDIAVTTGATPDGFVPSPTSGTQATPLPVVPAVAPQPVPVSTLATPPPPGSAPQQTTVPGSAQPTATPAAPVPTAPTLASEVQAKLDAIKPVESLIGTRTWDVAVTLATEFDQDPQKWLETYVKPEVDAYIAKMKAPELPPSDFAEIHAANELKKEFGDDFQYNPDEVANLSSDSAKYYRRFQALYQEGLHRHQASVDQMRQNQLQAEAQSRASMVKALEARGVPATAYDQVLAAAEQLKDAKHSYAMAAMYLDALGVLTPFKTQQSPAPVPVVTTPTGANPNALSRSPVPVPAPGASTITGTSSLDANARVQELLADLPDDFLTDNYF